MNNSLNLNTFFNNPYPWCNELNNPIKVPGYENNNKYTDICVTIQNTKIPN